MHDSILYEKVSKSLSDICSENSINRVNAMTVTVSWDSHMDENSLHEYLKHENCNLVGDWTEIKLKKRDIGKLTAIIEDIEGENLSG